MESESHHAKSEEELHHERMQAYMLKHLGHEKWHSFLLILMLAILILSQVGLFFWKKYRYESFMKFSLVGLWTIPFLISLFAGFYRMIFFWTIFTLITGRIIHLAMQKPLDKQTPRKIYTWFYYVYRINYILALLGYVMFMLEFAGISLFIRNVLGIPLETTVGYVGTLFLFYGLYFGVLGRDCAHLCTDYIASTMGFTGKTLPMKRLPGGMCAICGEGLGAGEIAELNCKHKFHDWCMRGWTIIGKKDTCPYCSEKVNMKELFKNPWEKQGIWWGQLLDSLRYLLVWNPLILFSVQLMLYFLD